MRRVLRLVVVGVVRVVVAVVMGATVQGAVLVAVLACLVRFFTASFLVQYGLCRFLVRGGTAGCGRCCAADSFKG
jgi:hypothetical protein